MLDISNEIPTKTFQIIAHKLVAKYPKSFQDYDDDGMVIGNGLITICNQLKERYKYLKVTHKRNSPVESTLPVPINKRKKLLSAKAGCVDWQPSPCGSNEDNEIKEKLKEIDLENWSDESVMELLQKSYAQQRYFINKTPTVIDIKNEWPILLKSVGIKFHFKRLMNKSIDLLSKNLFLKSENIINFGIKRHIIKSRPTENNEIIKCVLSIISKYFAEDVCEIFSEEEDFSSLEDIISPKIITKTEGDGTKRYNIVMEQEIINTYLEMDQALNEVFALYFMFNLEYPKKSSLTWEFIQFFFLKIYPQIGSKNLKKNSQTKIIGFFHKLQKVNSLIV
ncbi:uncharacterized protein LOC135143334 [Zophobas morio]|uniref:uncharacterized protein LOC135143334 n=1 Tax=Zophobas morio TaxID=2755281 RepID=UPI003083D2DD